MSLEPTENDKVMQQKMDNAQPDKVTITLVDEISNETVATVKSVKALMGIYIDGDIEDGKTGVLIKASPLSLAMLMLTFGNNMKNVLDGMPPEKLASIKESADLIRNVLPVKECWEKLL